MEPSRRLWAVAGLALGLAVFGVVLARPVALVGSILLVAWILSRQYLFYRAAVEFSEGLSVAQASEKTAIRTEETVAATLTATVGRPTRIECTVKAGLPITATAATPLELRLGPEQTTASITASVQWPVAGRHTFEQPTVTITDGLFREQWSTGPTETVTVEPRGPRNFHVGAGGDRIATAYGEHDAGQLGSGLEPAELREYVPGDTADRIDWKATARLGTPYVREFEAETDRKTMLIVDHRRSLAQGPADETKLEYLRELSLAVTDSASKLDDPLGLVTVGDEGVTERVAPATTPEQYRTIRRTLLNLDVTGESSTRVPHEARQGSLRGQHPNTLAEVRRALATLEAEEGPFADRLRPFYAERQQYLERISADPLYGAVETTLAREQGPVLTVLCTDDRAQTELLETVKRATRDGGTVLVLLAPTVLYEQGGLAEIERAYDQYVEFEEFRRELSRIDGVTALEVGPGDRLSAVLTAGENRSVRARAGGGS